MGGVCFLRSNGSKQCKVFFDACLAVVLQFASQPLLHLNLHYGEGCCLCSMGLASGRVKFANHLLLVSRWCFKLHTPRGRGCDFVVALAQSWKGRDLSCLAVARVVMLSRESFHNTLGTRIAI